MSKERPILFSGPMVRALLAGTKTQTRRAMKPQPTEFVGGPGVTLRDGSPAPLVPLDDSVEPYGREIVCPYGQPGDRLWVREAFRFPESLDHLSPAQVGNKAVSAGYPKPWCPTQFEADSSRRTPQEWRDFVTPPQANDAGRLRAGMHMPRWASRITLEITSVRVERLQDISADDARAEGCPDRPIPGAEQASVDLLAKLWYHDLWEQINGPGSWTANPWVWAIEFRRLP